MTETKQANLCRHLISAANTFPDALAVAVQKKHFNKLTYQEINFDQLNKRSDQIAHALNQYGLKAGHKAVLMVNPSLDFFALTFALFKAGIIPILVDPGMGIKNLKQCFAEAKPDAFIGIPKAHIARKLFAWGKQTITHNITVSGSSFWGGINLQTLLKKSTTEQPYKMVKLAEQEMAAILFTSGSTGTPKGVVYSHAIFEAQINVLKNDYAIEHGERDLATFPLFSLFGPALGMASIVPEMDASKPIKANPNYIFAAIKKYQCTNLFANPALIEVLGQSGQKQKIKLKTLKRVISAGAPATLSSIARFTTLLNSNVEILNSYGATESLPISKIGSAELLQTEVITNTGGGICVGVPVDGISVSIIKITENVINEWQESLNIDAYQIGEIVVKGPQVSQAYYHREKATVEAKITDGNSVRHRMGDLGYLDKDGRLWMCGRKAHRVESTHLDSAKSYYSIPCERIINTHPSIKRSALVEISVKGKQTPLVCIELEDTQQVPQAQLFTDLQDLCSKHAHTTGISLFMIHKGFPMDIRHNAKIFREKLASWAQQQIKD